MLPLDRRRPERLPSASRSRLTRSALRRPTSVPDAFAVTAVGRYLLRLRWLFGGT
ncbi:MAG: hypothetical protein ABJA61_02410 [Caldimonas sp.]